MCVLSSLGADEGRPMMGAPVVHMSVLMGADHHAWCCAAGCLVSNFAIASASCFCMNMARIGRCQSLLSTSAHNRT